MNKFFSKLSYDKKLTTFFIITIVDLVLMFALVVFDIIQFIIIKSDPNKLSNLFIPLNITLIVLAMGTIIMLVIMLVKKIITEKSKNEIE